MSNRDKPAKPGERARDEARPDHHLSFAAGEWDMSDQRAADERFGKTRSDGGAPASQYVRGTDGDAPDVVEDDEDEGVDETTETSASPGGMGHGGKPQKARRR